MHFLPALSTPAALRVLGLAACLGLVGVARDARAEPESACEPCESLLEVGHEWRIRFVAGKETYEGKEDRPAIVSVFHVEQGGQCCLARKKTDYPGVYLWGVDPARHRVFLGGHDARWAALATDGIWSYDVATGNLEPVVARIWNHAPCDGNRLRFAAILQSDPPPRPKSKDGAEGPRPDPHRGTFRLVAVDLGANEGPTSHPIATGRTLGEFDASFDMEAFAAKFHWSPDCKVLTYALSPKGRTKTFKLPAPP